MSGVTLQVTETLSKRLGSVLIVGGGRMGTAICAGLLNIEGMTPAALTLLIAFVRARRETAA